MKKVLIVALLILLCACTQNEMPIIETDTTPPETTIEPIQIIEEEIITTITNIDDWDLLGLNYTKDSEPYISLRAFLEKNTEIFEVSFGTTGLGLHLEYFNTVVSGMYDDFKTVEFGDYS
ncbi:MAG: hypothetical protein FWF15_07165, partial [Oscillospiraceae bacterium]|nr:hypothetical protein [Oscillospiraceae bacterium]